MRQITDYFRGASVLLSDAAGSCLFLYMVSAAFRMEECSVPLVVFSGYLLALFLADDILAGIGLPVNAYLVFNLLGIGAGSFFTVKCSGFAPAYEFHTMYIWAAAAGCGIHGAAAAYFLPRSNGIVRQVDILIVLLGLYLAVAAGTGQEPDGELILVALLAAALDLWIIGRLRTGDEAAFVVQGAGAGGKLILLGLVVGSILLTGFLAGTASGQVHSAADFLLIVLCFAGDCLEAIFGVIGLVLGKIILLLMLFSPFTSGRMRENIAENVGVGTEEIAEGPSGPVPVWILAAVGAVLLAVLCVWILYACRHLRLKRRRAGESRRKVRRKSHFFEAVRRLVRQAAEAVRFEWEYLCCRKTPQGLLVLAERTVKEKELKRRRDEGPGEYMRRLARAGRQAVCQQSPEEASSLLELSFLLDRIYYGDGKAALTEADYKRYAEEIRSLCLSFRICNSSGGRREGDWRSGFGHKKH